MNESNDMTRKQDEDLSSTDRKAFEKWWDKERGGFLLEEDHIPVTERQLFKWESEAFLAACAYKDAQYRPRYEESEDATYVNGRKFYSEKAVKDFEEDWIKMRDIAEETQRKLDQAIEVIRFYGKSEHWKLNRNNHAPLFSKCEDDLGEKARDFLAKIEGKNDEPCNHQWQYFASGHALCLNCEETKKPVKFPPNKEEF